MTREELWLAYYLEVWKVRRARWERFSSLKEMPLTTLEECQLELLKAELDVALAELAVWDADIALEKQRELTRKESRNAKSPRSELLVVGE